MSTPTPPAPGPIAVPAPRPYNRGPLQDPEPDPNGLSDERLLGLIAAQSRGALTELYARHSGAVYSLALRILRDPGAAEEVAQDAFLSVWRRAGTYRGDRGSAISWLLSITHHRAIDEIRRRTRRARHASYRDIETADVPAGDATDPVRLAAARRDRDLIDEALSGLRPERRAVVELAYFGGLTHTEIAGRLGVPLGTVKTRMRLAMRDLRDAIDPGRVG